MGFCTHGSLSFPCLLAMKYSLVYFLRLSGASSSRTSGGSFFSLSFSCSVPSSVSASEVDMLLGSTTGSLLVMGSLELSASLCFFFFFFLLGRANNLVFYLHLIILLDPLRMPLRIERVLGVCSTPSFYTISMYILFGIISKQIFLHIRNLFKLSLNHMKMLNTTFNIIKCST